jgi:hypothetical protein
MTEAYRANPTGGAICDHEGAAAALGIAKWLCLAATPTFAIMALLTMEEDRGEAFSPIQSSPRSHPRSRCHRERSQSS